MALLFDKKNFFYVTWSTWSPWSARSSGTAWSSWSSGWPGCSGWSGSAWKSGFSGLSGISHAAGRATGSSGTTWAAGTTWAKSRSIRCHSKFFLLCVCSRNELRAFWLNISKIRCYIGLKLLVLQLWSVISIVAFSRNSNSLSITLKWQLAVEHDKLTYILRMRVRQFARQIYNKYYYFKFFFFSYLFISTCTTHGIIRISALLIMLHCQDEFIFMQ